MKLISLSNSPRRAIVDDEDFEWLNQWTWRLHDNRYAVRYTHTRNPRKQIGLFMHRVINDTPKGSETDHINGNILDNRRSNLRSCNRSQNNANKHLYKNNKLGAKGVTQIGNNYMGRIRKNGELVYLGIFKTIEEASSAYELAAIKLHGEFFRR